MMNFTEKKHRRQVNDFRSYSNILHINSLILIIGGPDNPQYDPQPINTSSVALNNDLNTIVQKFSEHYHDAWASK